MTISLNAFHFIKPQAPRPCSAHRLLLSTVGLDCVCRWSRTKQMYKSIELRKPLIGKVRRQISKSCVQCLRYKGVFKAHFKEEFSFMLNNHVCMEPGVGGSSKSKTSSFRFVWIGDTTNVRFIRPYGLNEPFLATSFFL